MRRTACFARRNAVEARLNVLASKNVTAVNNRTPGTRPRMSCGLLTAQYNVEPVMNYNQKSPPVVTGFRVTNILDVKLHDISKAGKLIDDLIASGANTVYGVSFSFSDPSALMRQAAR